MSDPRASAVVAAELLLTVADLAAALRLKPATVRRMVARGEIGYHRLNGKDLRFTRADLEGLLRRTRIEPWRQEGGKS